MNLREELNRMDHEALDANSKFYDLRNLVEAVNLSQDDKQNLKKYIDKNDPKGANDYLQGLLSGKPITNNTSNPVAGLQTTQETINESDDVDWDDDWDMPADEVATCEWCEETSPIDDLVKTDMGWICRDCIQELDSRGEPYTVFHNANYYDELDESLLTEGIYDIIRAIVPHKGSAHELEQDIYKILGRNEFGTSTHPTFVDVFSKVGGSLDKALARLLDYGIKAKKLSQDLPESVDTAYDDDMGETILDEGRFDLVPMKCTSIESKNSYWSPYDKKEQEFAEYGTRFRYDTRKGCMDAINDPDKDLGYGIDNKKKFKGHNDKGDDKMEEKLILSEDNTYDDVSDKSLNSSPDIELGKNKIAINNTVVDRKDLSPEIIQMIGSPIKANGEPKMEAWILIKLYEHTIYEGNPYIERDELLRRAGVANWDREGQSSTYFNYYSELGLARLNHNRVYPGKNLDSWFNGTANLVLSKGPNAGKNYAGGKDLSSYLGKGDLSSKSSQGAQPNRSHPGSQVNKVGSKESKPEESETDFEYGDSDFTSLDFFDEALDEKEAKRASVFKKYDDERSEKVKAAYRKAKHLEEDAEITESDYDDYIFKTMCSRNGWNFDISKKDLLR